MKKKFTYREYFPGYKGHIPLKNEVIGQTVGGTNELIKKIMTKEPPTEEKLIPSTQDDYAFYDKNYYNDDFARGYPLEEDQIYGNTSKRARTWVNGSKVEIYPQHIPDYQAHIPGVKSSNLFGKSYAKITAVAIKGDYNKSQIAPLQERYQSLNKHLFPETEKLKTCR